MDRQRINQLIRMAADGELTPALKAEFEAHVAANPGDQECVRFERQLRQAVARAMKASADEIPASTAGAVKASLRRSEAPNPVAEPRRLRFVVPSGLAAGIVLIVSASVIIGIAGQQGWFWRVPELAPVSNPLRDLIQNEHQASASSSADWESRKHSDSIEAARETIIADLGPSVIIPDWQVYGYDFKGSAASRIPPSGATARQLRYEDRQSGEVISVWIQKASADARRSLREGTAYILTDRGSSGAAHTLAWVEADVLYYLRSEDAETGRKLAISMGMPRVDPQPIPWDF